MGQDRWPQAGGRHQSCRLELARWMTRQSSIRKALCSSSPVHRASDEVLKSVSWIWIYSHSPQPEPPSLSRSIDPAPADMEAPMRPSFVRPSEAARMESKSGSQEQRLRTLVLERTPLVPSIQMYSARTAPFWSSFMYFRSCKDSQRSGLSGLFPPWTFVALTFVVLETTAGSVCEGFVSRLMA